jgi:hypothetical protein
MMPPKRSTPQETQGRVRVVAQKLDDQWPGSCLGRRAPGFPEPVSIEGDPEHPCHLPLQQPLPSSALSQMLPEGLGILRKILRIRSPEGHRRP